MLTNDLFFVKSKNHFSQISYLLDNGKRIDDPVKMADIFNHYFVNVGSCTDKSIPRTKKSPMDYLESSNPNSMLSAPAKEQEIGIIIQSLNPEKAVGSYSIPTFLLKVLSKYTILQNKRQRRLILKLLIFHLNLVFFQKI